MRFGKNNPLRAEIIVGIIAGVLLFVIGYFSFEYVKYKKTIAAIEDSIDKADKLLDKGMPEDSLKIYNDVLKVLSVKEEPKLYAHANNRLGVCYSKRAIKGNKEENSTQAILAYKEVLKIYTFEESPVNYAMMQNNLGNAYHHLSKMKAKNENSTKAIRAFKEAV